jgi:hypothetical protein
MASWAYRGTMSDTNTPNDNLGTDGTIPNTEDGIAVGHDPDGSHFNPEEEDAGSYTDTEGDDRADRPAESSGSYTDVDE